MESLVCPCSRGQLQTHAHIPCLNLVGHKAQNVVSVGWGRGGGMTGGSWKMLREGLEISVTRTYCLLVYLEILKG